MHDILCCPIQLPGDQAFSNHYKGWYQPSKVGHQLAKCVIPTSDNNTAELVDDVVGHCPNE
jgi:hypothetical protein|tara:strand:- start:7 stop:189 length:183 start_codon:yes stop_codon:yes gene_type:complete